MLYCVSVFVLFEKILEHPLTPQGAVVNTKLKQIAKEKAELYISELREIANLLIHFNSIQYHEKLALELEVTAASVSDLPSNGPTLVKRIFFFFKHTTIEFLEKFPFFYFVSGVL